MDLRKEILKEHSKRQMLRMVEFVGNNPARFKALIDVFLEGPYRITQRAAWPMANCVERHPALVLPHLSALLRHLEKPGIHDAVKRNTMRLLQFIDIPKRLHGRVADICFQYLQDKKEAVAVRVFSMTALGSIAVKNPDLKPELIMMIEDELPYAGPAFRSRARRVLKELRTNK